MKGRQLLNPTKYSPTWAKIIQYLPKNLLLHNLKSIWSKPLSRQNLQYLTNSSSKYITSSSWSTKRFIVEQVTI